MQLNLHATTNDHEELLQAIMKIYSEQKTLPDPQTEFYAIC